MIISLAGKVRNVGAIRVQRNAKLYTSEQTRVSTKSRIDLQSRERFDGSPSQNLFFDGNHECRRYGTTP